MKHQQSEELAEKERIFSELAEYLSKLSPRKLEYGEGFVTAYTLNGLNGEELVELQTDFGDHLDLLVIVRGHPYSLGGAYIHGIKNWLKFAGAAKECMKLIFDRRLATEEEWMRGGEHIGGDLIISSEKAPAFRLHDRTGAASSWFAKRIPSERVLLREDQ